MLRVQPLLATKDWSWQAYCSLRYLLGFNVCSYYYVPLYGVLGGAQPTRPATSESQLVLRFRSTAEWGLCINWELPCNRAVARAYCIRSTTTWPDQTAQAASQASTPSLRHIYLNNHLIDSRLSAQGVASLRMNRVLRTVCVD